MPNRVALYYDFSILLQDLKIKDPNRNNQIEVYRAKLSFNRTVAFLNANLLMQKRLTDINSWELKAMCSRNIL